MNPQFSGDTVFGPIHDDELDQVLELLDIARPVIAGKQLFHLIGKLKMAPAGFDAKLIGKKIRQRRDVFQPHAQRRYIDPNDIEPVEKSFSNITAFNEGRQILSGGGDDSNIACRIGCFKNFGLIDHFQQSSLAFNGHLADFFQQQGALMRGDKYIVLFQLRIIQHQQLFFEKIRRQLGYAQLDKWLVVPL